nr:hypothetical protein CFP56_57479 [Quercus suber]
MKPSSHCQVRANHMVSQSESFSGSEGEGPQQTLKRKSNQTPPLLDLGNIQNSSIALIGVVYIARVVCHS